ncbi:hypothetical protein [Actinomadura sp. 6N118]|uniref:hypothetical protein n=1 Tax=Actinomadura sp. 6N118 TaxID=3375151 RepID=UPI0037A77F86
MYQSIWVGEKRLSWGLVNQFRDVPGFGRLPELQVFGGAIVQGARARLVRAGAVVVEDLHVGAVIREKIIGSRLESVDKTVRKCAVATGHQDFQFGDHLELYLRADDQRLDPALVPGYQDGPAEYEQRLGQAEVREVSDSLAGPVAHAAVTQGRLAVGSRVRVVRNGQPVAEALRLLFMGDETGRMVNELTGGSGTALYLAHPGLRPGDTVQAYEVAPPPWIEVRISRLEVIEANPDGPGARAWVRRLDFGSLSDPEPAVGQRARVLRDDVVIADGLTLGHLAEDGLGAQILRSSLKPNLQDAIQLGLDFPHLNQHDIIELYQLFSRNPPS